MKVMKGNKIGVKVQVFWEGHKFEKNIPLIIWRYSVSSNVKRKIFSNFVAFSEYLNFKSYSWTGCKEKVFQPIAISDSEVSLELRIRIR